MHAFVLVSHFYSVSQWHQFRSAPLLRGLGKRDFHRHTMVKIQFVLEQSEIKAGMRSKVIPPEEERSGPLDIPLAVALEAGLEDERVGVEIVVGGDGAVLAAAAGVLHNNRHWQRDAAQIF